jgi:hypothetical protein
MAAISALTTRSGKPRALSGAAIRMLGHDVDGERTRIGDSLRTIPEGDGGMNPSAADLQTPALVDIPRG